MPRYFFHRTDGVDERDHDGIELPDHVAARRQAINYASETLRNHPEKVWDGDDLKIEVSDDVGLVLFVVTIYVTDAPAVSPTILR